MTCPPPAGSGSHPRYSTPRSIASHAERGRWPQLDPGLVRGAVEWGIERTQAALHRHDIAAALLTDPVNVRYVSGTSVMPVWTLHSVDRYLLVPADGDPVLWEYAGAPPELISPYARMQTRIATGWAVFGCGDRAEVQAARFAADVLEVLREWGVNDGRIGVDRLDAYGFLALQGAGLNVVAAQLAIEQARAVKGNAEIELIRRSVAVCDAAVSHMHEGLRPGLSENEVWAQFVGAAFADGGEYVECRLLSSGPRTNPWFREASERRIEKGDLVSFDTDLIGPAGYLADLSRAFLVGSSKPSDEQRRLYADAQAFLAEIMTELKPGVAFDEAGTRLAARLPDRYVAQRYPFIAHGSGLSDEYPIIGFDEHHSGEIEEGMVFSIEAYVGEEGAAQGLKLEEQVLITSTGVELLSKAPHDEFLAVS